MPCGTCAMCIACAHTHTFIRPVACLLCSCCVVLWFRAIRIHGCVVCACCWCCCCLCFLLLFCFVFFSVCLLTGALGGSPPRFPTEAVGCLLFEFCRCSIWFIFVFSNSFPFLLSFPVPLSGLALLHVKYCNKNK